jgi:hypothetical protein
MTNIWGYEHKLKEVKKEYNSLKNEEEELSDRIYFAGKNRQKYMKLKKEDKNSILVEEAISIAEGMRNKLSKLAGRMRWLENNILKERKKKEKKR